MLKYTKQTILILALLLLANIPTRLLAENFKLKTIVIDPGHGGSPGAVVGSVKEKDITLAVALNLGKKIKTAFPDVKVIYTRTTDKEVDLQKRSQIANDALADLFISIHANSAGKATSASGTETFVMGYDKSSKNMEVAMKENQVVTYESDYKQKYEGFDPHSNESYILFSLMQYSYVSQSMLFASYIQDEYSSKTTMKNRGVKQGPFLVLWRCAMPSVLTEIGFLTNPTERQYITSKAGQEKVSLSIFNAFKRYKASVESQSIIDNPSKEQVKEKTIEKKPIVTPKPTVNTNNIFFCIQLLSSRSKTNINNLKFGKYHTRVEQIFESGLYKYQIRNIKNYKEALSLQLELRSGKFKDAFVIAYNKEKKIAVTEAIKLLKK